MEDRRMQIEEIVGVSEPFTSDTSDLTALEQYATTATQSQLFAWLGWLWYAIPIGIGLLLAFSSDLGFFEEGTHWTVFCTYALTLVGVVVFLFGFGTLIKHLSAKPQSRNSWRDGPWQVKMTASGVIQEGPEASFFYRWGIVAEIGEMDNHLLMFFSTDTAIVVPRRAFSSDPMFRIFVEQAFRLRDEFRRRDAEKPSLPNTDITRRNHPDHL